MEEMKIKSESYIDDVGNFFMDVTLMKGDEVQYKRIPIQEYLEMFQKNMKREERMMVLPSLPESVIWAEVSVDDPQTFNAVVYYPAETRIFEYESMRGGSSHLMELPYPAMIARVEVSKGVRVNTYLAALKESVEPTKDTGLYHFPFGNVYGDMHCCYGNVQVTGIKDVTEAPIVLNKYLSARTNEDLWGQAKRFEGVVSQNQMIDLLLKCKEFPVERLVSTGQTAASFMK